jgi:hypothetical protein
VWVASRSEAGDALLGGIEVVAVRGEPQETRRVVLARRPGALDGSAARVGDALIAAARAGCG